MKKIPLAFLMLLLYASGSDAQQNSSAASKNIFSTDGKKLSVYTTADSTDLRLSLTESGLAFTHFGQPLETQVCVFVDPNHTFQTMLGIGGALTDASAETFFKLPKEKQEEFLQAYYNPQKGIGYTLGRTNINSCDFSSDTYTYVKE